MCDLLTEAHCQLTALAADFPLTPLHLTTTVAVLGKVSSGKSSFINDFIGTPVGLATATKVVTLISYGDSNDNLSNHKFSDRLPGHLVFIDTPGIRTTDDNDLWMPEIPGNVDLVIFFVDPTAGFDRALLAAFNAIHLPKRLVLGKLDSVATEEERHRIVADLVWGLGEVGCPRTDIFTRMNNSCPSENLLFTEIKLAINAKRASATKTLHFDARGIAKEIDRKLQADEASGKFAARVELGRQRLVQVAFLVQISGVGVLALVEEGLWKFQAAVAALGVSLTLLLVVGILRRCQTQRLPQEQLENLLATKKKIMCLVKELE